MTPPIVLERIQKRMTREHAIEGMNLAREADIKVLASFIFGLGGKEHSVEHAINTTSLLNIMQPDAIAPMALAVQPGIGVGKRSKPWRVCFTNAIADSGRRKILARKSRRFRLLLLGATTAITSHQCVACCLSSQAVS